MLWFLSAIICWKFLRNSKCSWSFCSWPLFLFFPEQEHSSRKMKYHGFFKIVLICFGVYIYLSQQNKQNSWERMQYRVCYICNIFIFNQFKQMKILLMIIIKMMMIIIIIIKPNKNINFCKWNCLIILLLQQHRPHFAFFKQDQTRNGRLIGDGILHT